MKERFDLVIPREFCESPVLAPLLDVIRCPQFRRDVEALGGFDVAEIGRVVADLSSTS